MRVLWGCVDARKTHPQNHQLAIPFIVLHNKFFLLFNVIIPQSLAATKQKGIRLSLVNQSEFKTQTYFCGINLVYPR